MVKTIAKILFVIAVLWTVVFVFKLGNSFADTKEFPKNITVNSLTQNGYKIINIETVSIKNNQNMIYGTYYHLVKNGDLISCFLLQGDVSCYRP